MTRRVLFSAVVGAASVALRGRGTVGSKGPCRTFELPAAGFPTVVRQASRSAVFVPSAGYETLSSALDACEPGSVIYLRAAARAEVIRHL